MTTNRVYHWYSPRRGYFATTTPFIEHEKGLRHATVRDYFQHHVKQIKVIAEELPNGTQPKYKFNR